MRCAYVRYTRSPQSLANAGVALDDLFFCGFMKYLAAPLLFDIPCSRILLMSSYRRVFSVRTHCATLNVERRQMHATQRICIDNIYEHSYFYSINSLSSFSKRSYRGLALRNFIEIFTEMRSDIFTRPTVTERVLLSELSFSLSLFLCSHIATFLIILKI